jgi:hypothetical protein
MLTDFDVPLRPAETRKGLAGSRFAKNPLISHRNIASEET